MKISIAMATHNGCKYLEKQLNSFLSQTRYPDELIVTDDCSSDGTLEILRAFKDRAPFHVRIYSNEKRLGFVANFNKALELCSGDIVFLSDQDDIWIDSKIEEIVHKFSNSMDSPMLVHSDFSCIDESDDILAKSKQTYSKKNTMNVNRSIVRALYHGEGTGCTVAVNKKLLEIVLPIPIPKNSKHLVSHDHWLLYSAIVIGTVKYINRQLILHRAHGQNTVSKALNKKINLKKIFLPNIRNLTIKKIHISNILVQRYQHFAKNYFSDDLIFLSRLTDQNIFKVIIFCFRSDLFFKEKRLYSFYIFLNICLFRLMGLKKHDIKREACDTDVFQTK